MRLTILHTNDIHGRIDGLARVATLVAAERAAAEHPVLYVDGGDVEETTVRISNLTKGAGMHRLLSAAGCDLAAVGNATWLRYGPQVLADAAAEASYPLLVANLRPVPGTQSTTTIDVDGGRIGFVGVTDPFLRLLDGPIEFGVESLPIVPLVRGLARGLRDDGADLVVLMSHVGYENPNLDLDDRVLARELDGVVDLIVGAHSHTLLSHGERVGGVLVVQAGNYAEHLGRIEIDGALLTASVAAVPEDTERAPAVLAAAAQVEREVESALDEELAVLSEPLDGDTVAEILRLRMSGDIGLVIEGGSLDRPLPAGPLTRRALWETSHTTGNPGIVDIRGDRLATMIERGREPAFERLTVRPLRGRPRGRLAVVGLDGAIDPERTYAVAATDFELERFGGLVDAEWNLHPRYDFPTIVREAIEEHLCS